MKVEFNLSRNEKNKVGKLIAKSSGLNKGLGILHSFAVFLSALLITFSLMQIIPNTMKVYQVYPVYIICLGLLLAGIVIYYLSKWYVGKKILETTGLDRAKVTYEILPDKLDHFTDDGLRQEIMPKEIKNFVDIKDYLLIFVRDNYAYYIPLRAFSDNHIRTEFKNKINELLKNC